MNFFEIFNDENFENIPQIKTENGVYSLFEIKEFVYPVYKELVLSPIDKVLIQTDNNFDFLIYLTASIFAKKEIYILFEKLSYMVSKLDIIKLFKPVSKRERGRIDTEIDLDKIFLNLYTSGSTGTPKKIQKSVKNVLIEADDMFNECIELSADKKETISSTTVFYHMFGLTSHIFIYFSNPDKLILNTKRIDYPEDIEDEILVSSPSFLEKIKKYSPVLKKNPKVILSAGDKLNGDVFSYLKGLGIKVFDIYGCSEFGVIGYKTDFEQKYMHTFKSVELIQNNGKIIINSPYFINQKDILSDNAEIQDSKHFLIKERTDRILKIQEKRVSPLEIENILYSTGFVKDAYCFKYENKLASAVVLNDKGIDGCLNEGKMHFIKMLKAEISKKSDIIPQKWRFLYEIFKTNTGKTDKAKIEKIFGLNLTMPFIKEIKKDNQSMIIKMIFPRFSNFFKGHFDGFAILPGVVQLYFAKYFMEELFGIKVEKSIVKKIKFSHIIKPDEVVELKITKLNEELSFCYKKEDIIFSSGNFREAK